MVMIVLQTFAKCRRYGKPVIDIYRVVIVGRIRSCAETPVVCPEILDEIYPERKKPDAEPERQRKKPASEGEPEDSVTAEI